MIEICAFAVMAKRRIGMKNRLISLLMGVLVMISCTVTVLSADKTVEPDVVYSASELVVGQNWTKNGKLSAVQGGDLFAIKYTPTATLGNGIGFIVDVPVEKANYIVIRQHTNLDVNDGFQVVYSHNDTFDFSAQYGASIVDYTTEARVIVIDMSSVARLVKQAGETAVKYFKMAPWMGQTWTAESGKAKEDYFYNVYSIAFFANSKDASDYAKELKKNLPDISEEEKLVSASVTPANPTQTVIPTVVDDSKLIAMEKAFKSERVDNPFIKGYDDGTFNPDGNMTRAEACTVITRLLTAEEAIKGKYTTKFSDVKAGAWYYDYVAYLENKGYLGAYTGAFKPDQKITRAEFVELVYQMGKIAEGDKEVSFSDVPVTHPRYDVIMAAAKSGLVNGKTATTFDPDGNIKRSEVVKVICAALGRTPTADGIIKVDGFKDVPATHWAYPYVIEASYRHSLKVQDDGSEKWNDIVENELIIYPEYPEQIDRNYDFEVTVTQGDKTASIPVYDETRQPAATRNPYGDNYRRFAEFAFKGEPVRIDIKCNMSFSEYTLVPAVKDIPSTVNGNVISVYVDEPMQLVLRLGDEIGSNNKMLAVFVDPPEKNVPDKNDKNVIWVDGWYETANGELKLSAGQTLYVAPGAVCNARVLANGDNIRITGRGIIRDPYDTRTPNKHGYNYIITFNNNNDCLVDGIKVVDCRFYHIYANAVDGLEINNVKIISNQISTDGYSLSGKNIYMHNSFADVGDDVFTGGGANKLYEDMVVGSTCGVFSLAGTRTNETYRNISIFRADEAIFKNFYGSGAFTGATFENIFAVDCPSTPFFIHSMDQGSGYKEFNFKNLSINTPTGRDDGKVSDFKSYRNYVINIKDGDEFGFNFENMYVDGKLITSEKEFAYGDNSTSGAKFTFKVNRATQAGIPLASNKTVLKTPYVAPSTSVVPLGANENVVLNPDFEDGAIEWVTENFALIELKNDAQSGKLSMFVPTKVNENAGLITAVTEGIKRGDKGEYVLEFYAKGLAATGNTVTAQFRYYSGTVSKYTAMRNTVIEQEFALTNEWQKFTLPIDVVFSNINYAQIQFMNKGLDGTAGFFIDNVKLTKVSN